MSEFSIRYKGITAKHSPKLGSRHRGEHFGRTPRGTSPDTYSVKQYFPRWGTRLEEANQSLDTLSSGEAERMERELRRTWQCGKCRACSGPGLPRITGSVIELSSARPLPHVETMTDAHELLRDKPCQKDTLISLRRARASAK